MSITDENKIDGMGINPANPSELAFFISDHFDWVVEGNEKVDGIHLSLFKGKNCYVTVNPDTGFLIQTNPHKGEK